MKLFETISEHADIFAPCALGAIINDDTIPQLKVEIVYGGASNPHLAAVGGLVHTWPHWPRKS